MSDHAFVLDRVSKRYGRTKPPVTALSSVSLHIDKGEIVAIAGPSGSGKSSLMNILGCLDQPDTGGYTFLGREIASLSESEIASVRCSNIGFIFQGFNLLPRLTASENIALPMLYAGGSRRTALSEAMKVLDIFEMTAFAGRLPSQLSGGQQQRIAIARALINKPDLILADEPTGSLDSHTAADIVSLLWDVSRTRGITIVIVTHDESVAHRCQRVIKIKDGSVVSHGYPSN